LAAIKKTKMKKYLILTLLVVGLNNILLSQTKCDTLVFNSKGSNLIGYFFASEKSDSPTLLFTQGFMDSGDIWNIGETLSNNGINVFQFDFRGCHSSEGKQSLMNSQEDIDAALFFLNSQEMVMKYGIDKENIIFGGYSYGGHMSLLYAINHPEIKRVISISGGDLGIFSELVKSNPSLRKGYSDFFQSIKKPNGPVDFEFDDPIQELIDNQEYFYILKQVDSLSNVDIFLTGGFDDNVVSMEDYILPLYRKLKKNKSVIVLAKVYQTGHSYKSVSEELLTDIENWIKKE
jgi:pimeloyl-ACP methyl ester carboxylesterase